MKIEVSETKEADRGDEAMEILNSCYDYLHGQPIPNITNLLKDLVFDCGIDGRDLGPQDFEAVLRNQSNGKWIDVQFACTAVLAQYTCFELSNYDFVKSVAAILLLSNCIRHGHGEWEFAINSVLSILVNNKDKCSLQVVVLRYALAQ